MARKTTKKAATQAIWTVNALVDAVADGMSCGDALALAPSDIGRYVLGFEPDRDFWTDARRGAYAALVSVVRGAGAKSASESAREIAATYDASLERAQAAADRADDE